MTSARRSLAHLRSPSRDMTAVSVQMHRQSPAGPRYQGWVVAAANGAGQYVVIDGNEDWYWTTLRREASQFLTKTTADRWIAGNLGAKAAKAVEVVA